MSNYNLWNAKNLTKRLEQYESYVEKVKGWIKRDKADLNRTLKKLTKEENLLYGCQMGFIDLADYQIQKQKMEDKEDERNR